jgi:hypothetical protein
VMTPSRGYGLLRELHAEQDAIVNGRI